MQSLQSKENSGSHAFDDCSDITSDDFEKYVKHLNARVYDGQMLLTVKARLYALTFYRSRNFMSSLLPRPRSQVAQVAAASHPPVPARNSSAISGALWNSQFSGTSLKDIADMLCTSTRRN